MDIRDKYGKKKLSWTEEETKDLVSFGKYGLFIIFCFFLVIMFNKEIAIITITIKGLISKI